MTRGRKGECVRQGSTEIYIYTYIYGDLQELVQSAQAGMEGETCHDLPPTSWRTREVGGVIQSSPKAGERGVLIPRAGEGGHPGSGRETELPLPLPSRSICVLHGLDDARPPWGEWTASLCLLEQVWVSFRNPFTDPPRTNVSSALQAPLNPVKLHKKFTVTERISRQLTVSASHDGKLNKV